MTDKQIKIKCALACGYKWVSYLDRLFYLGKINDESLTEERRGRLQEAGDWDHEVPDYLNNQDACEDFWRVLESEKYSISLSSRPDDHAYMRYIGILMAMVGGKFNNGSTLFSHVCRILRATPRQKCEAFLRAIGEWEDDGITNGYEGE